MPQDTNPKTLTTWIDVPSPCARCNLPVKVQCSKNYSRIVTILCSKCGWKLELDPIRAAARAQERTPDDPDAIPPGAITPEE